MTKVTNPEKQCIITPESFSEESRIIELSIEDNRRGIILDSPKEFADALRVYNNGSIIESGDTQRHDLEAIGEDHGAMAAGLALFAGAVINRSDTFIERLCEEAISKLKENGRFYRNFDYTFNNFQKTIINGKRVGNRYILELYAAYVGDKPEKGLAKVLGKPLALLSSRVAGRLSVVDDWWFNIDLSKAVSGLPLPKGDSQGAEKWAEYFVSGGYSGEAPDFEFGHKGRKFSLSMSLRADIYLGPEDGSRNDCYIRARGNSIVGGAWTTYDETGSKKVDPRVLQPSLVFSVSLFGERNCKPPAVTSEEMTAVQDAAEYIKSFLK